MRLPARLLRRKPDSNKADYGHILILAGSARFSGAAVLAAEAAMRSGSGLVTIGIPKGINSGLIKIKPKEIMTYPLPETSDGSLSVESYRKILKFVDNINVLVMGCGLSQNTSTQALVRKIVASIAKPMIIDADGLNALSGHLNLFRNKNYVRCAKILTPHPGEMARLIGTTVDAVEKNRIKSAVSLAKELGVVVVLKGHQTVVASEQGCVYINKTGNPGMATAGSGDVLAGIIGSFLGQGLDSFNAAKYGVYLHGFAGDLAAEEKTQLSLISSDIIYKLPQAISKLS